MMKIRQSVGICISLGMLLSGCRSGMYSIDTDGKSDSNKDKLPYRIVDALDPKSYSVDYLPVEVNVSKSKGSDDSVALCCLTLGIIPAFYDDYENYRVMVQTPIGTKLGTGSIHAKSWVGWICLIPYPGAADFRSNDPKLPYRVMEEKLKDQLVEQLVSQFSKEEYVSYVKDLNEKREKEAKRVEQKVHEIEAFISAGKFEEARQVVAEEKASPNYDRENSEASMIALSTLIAAKEKEEADRKAREKAQIIEKQNRDKELARIKEKKAQIEKLLDEKKYVEVMSLCEAELGNNNYLGSSPDDAQIWQRLKSLASDKQMEDMRNIQEREYRNLLTRVNEKNVDAFVELGDLYAVGNLVVSRDKDKAKEYYERASKGGREGMEARIWKVMSPTEQLSYLVKKKMFKDIGRVQGSPWSYDHGELKIGWNCPNWHDNALCRRGASPVMFQAQKYYGDWDRASGDPRWFVSSVDDDGVWLRDDDNYNRKIFVYTSDTYVDADELKEGWYLYVGILKTFSSTVHSYVRVPGP